MCALNEVKGMKLKMKEYGIVLENVDLKKYNTYGIGGKAKYLIKPYSKEKLIELIKWIQDNKMPWFILGNGSNVILPDEDFNGIIIKLDKLDNISIDNEIIKAESGISLGKFVEKLLEIGFTNYAPLMGIPGLLGGAIIGNAGAYKVAIFDYLIDVTIMDEQGNIKVLKKDEINYGYRSTEFKDKKNIILEATFQGIKGDINKSKEEIKENLIKRKNTQPLEYKNAGSVFKNPLNAAAGYLIENSGLKGYTIGGAQVSSKHANFIINYDNATSKDIKMLIKYIREKVEEKYDEKLVLEQVIVNWENHGKESKEEIK